MNRDVQLFIDDYFKDVASGNAAIFAGAGLSAPAGFVNWKGLMRPLADELGVDIELESDLIAIAQFYVNANGGARAGINKALIEALSADKPPTINHRLLARLPIATWWTTNYDQLIETSLKDAGRIVDVKWSVPQLANTRPRRDAVVYKMHGDLDRPDEAVVTRDDYERYATDRGAFINALAGDLASKTFLFLGFSFTDPNLAQVLARMRITFKANQKRHYAIFKQPKRREYKTDVEFEHAKVTQGLTLEDLKRFSVKAVLIDEYAEITEIISSIERRYRRRTVFVSGSAVEFSPWGESAVAAFMRELGAKLIVNGFRVVTGMGGGIGNALISGAIEAILLKSETHIDDVLIMRPFPRAIPKGDDRERIYDDYRENMIKLAGLALFLFGNKESGGQIVGSTGTTREFEIAQELGLVLLPVGATRYTASELSRLAADLKISAEHMSALKSLGAPSDDLMALVDPILEAAISMRDGK
jgi:hypothetical protein